jgi:RpiB/LacA/LacB family sugar-phosphate isomerase
VPPAAPEAEPRPDTIRPVQIAVGSDHAGFELKVVLADHLAAAGHNVEDLGTDNGRDSVDYPVFGAAVGRTVVEGRAELGVCVCGTGIGISIAANKIPGVRAALVHDVTTAVLAREHNDANVICFGGRTTGAATATDALDAFLDAALQNGRHHRRIEQIADLERPT